MSSELFPDTLCLWIRFLRPSWPVGTAEANSYAGDSWSINSRVLTT